MNKDELRNKLAEWRLANPCRILGREVGGYADDSDTDLINKAKIRHDFDVVLDPVSKDLHLTNAFMSESWVIGGSTGGSCWGGNANTPRPAEEEPEIWELDEFLEQVMPMVTHLQYKRLASKIGTLDYYVSEYYGNSYEYRVQYLRFDDLIAILGKD